MEEENKKSSTPMFILYDRINNSKTATESEVAEYNERFFLLKEKKIQKKKELSVNV